MPTLTIIAQITAKPGKVERMQAALLKLLEPTRAEEGCLQYDLHQDDERPEHFVFVERWASRELWQAHMGSRHLQAYKAATADALADFALHELTQIG